ncbi:MAG: hypothetical protein IKX24_08965 [Prevotella sp.]|nr:hypothetical protein [Prevotella sp.]
MKRLIVFSMFLWMGFVMGLLVTSCSGDDEDKKTNESAPKDVVAIDLGLPSGTKWASCNVGANKPEEYGGYYAWGETEEKDYYNWSSYIHCGGTEKTCYDLGSDISGTKYDVAHVKWGGNWRMPTYVEMGELMDNCTDVNTTLNGVNCRKFTSKINGNSIFLPIAGFHVDGGLNAVGYSYYWLSTQSPRLMQSAYRLRMHGIGSGFADRDDQFRYYGFSVRPVCK